ncbi:hypothetical protein [Duganella sp. Leaf126]|uniref:hypothetical protein n=1 Tax=Duganella sp. Leaf126 TaxID=1736266 RepID=UPI0009E6CD20|nr:hypothetical protein [Duganella sp. Leaf126]
MTERPILMNGAMVRATLDGTKSQTRRVMKRQPEYPIVIAGDPHTNRYQMEGREAVTLASLLRECPYGQPGDRLWVRETWRSTGDGGRADYLAPSDMQPHPVWYDADGAAPAERCVGKTRVSIHMPRWASRILLAIVSVRVERLNDCSEADARAEGITLEDRHMRGYCAGEYLPPAIRAYSELWDEINGAGSWAANPWVWVVEFKRVTP